MRGPVLALALLASACGATGEPPREPGRAAGRDGPAPRPPRGMDAPAPARGIDSFIARALERVSRVRELPARGPVRGRLVTRAEMIALVREELREGTPAEVLAAQTEELFALGLVPAEFDFEASLLELMESELAGFYQPKTKEMILGEDLRGAELAATLDHELVHALQDQHYDLEPRFAFREDASDEQSALHALAEGDATSAMFDALLAPQGRLATDLPDALIRLQVGGAVTASPENPRIPHILRTSLVSPYLDGVALVHWARRRGGWAAVDQLWRAPPATTEQLLHPEKLQAREPAEVVAVPPPGARGPARVIYHDVVGEQGLRLLFGEWMPERTAAESASDWGGDRLAVFRDGDRYALAWRVRFDTAGAAERGLGAFARGLLGGAVASSDEAGARAQRGASCVERADRGPFAVERRDRDVAVVAGPYDRASPVRGAGRCPDALDWLTRIFAAREP
ncbi:MAG: hypothetical protein OZ928_20340 [Polyangiaceae bacterium]|nr:hypothetical protein [Polyangiaceae bacterium]